MSLTKKVYLTISGYDIKLSDNLMFYQNDQLKLIFYINEYGIDYGNNATTRALMPVNPLNAILFIENPDGVDSVSSARIEDNAVTFYLDSTHTQYVGVSRMQLRLFDQDGCAITLPHFTFEIRENIYGSGDVRFQNVVMVDQTGTVILTEDNDLLDVGDILTMGTEVAYPQVAKTIKELPIKHGLDGTEKLIVEDNEATKQAPLGTIVDEIKQNSQEKIREIESELAQTNAQLSQVDSVVEDAKIGNGYYFHPPKQPGAAPYEADHFIDYTQFQPSEQGYAFLEKLRIKNGEYIKRELLGKDTSEQYDIYKYIFSPSNPSKTILLTTGIHGNETTLVYTMFRFLHYLVNEPEKYPQFTYIRENVRIVYIPFVNIWGMSQRPRQRLNVNGVDINRNFPTYFSDYNTDGAIEPGQFGYQGESPLSEKESQYVNNLFIDYPDAVGFCDFHNTGTTTATYYTNIPFYQDDTFIKNLMTMLSKDIVNPTLTLGSNKTPTSINHAYSYKIKSATVEWCDTNYGGLYESVEITKALEYISNIIFNFCKTENRTFIQEYYCNRSISITAREFAEVTQLKREISVPFVGLAKISGYIVVGASSQGLVRCLPMVGQYTKQNLHPYSVSKTTQWNSYASSITDGRTIIPFEATIPVKNTGYDLTGNLEVGLACSGSVDFNILKYKMTVELIPSDYGSYKVNQITF